MLVQVLVGGVVGIASGVRHAIEPDHLAAVSTFATAAPNTRSAIRFAAAWGAGHALMLLGVGGALLLTKREMPVPLEDAFELAVAVTLVALGVRSIVRALKADLQAVSTSGVGTWTQPLLVGLLHGLAGSGAITALALSTLSSPAEGLLFVALYGFGAMLGMSALAGLAGPPLARLARKERTLKTLVGLTGALSVAIGVLWAIRSLERFV